MSTQSSTGPIVAASIGVFATGFLAYALYFDHRRRTDPDFRKALKRESKRQAKAAKEEAEAEDVQRRKKIRDLVAEANAEGYPSDPERVEEYFMTEVAEGEKKISDGSVGSDPVDAALCFYKALKVYPNQEDLIHIFDKTVPKASDLPPILDILAQMIAADPSIRIRSSTAGSAASDRGVDD
ncbi:protein import receptor MAS20 [Rhizodiscina lignyota]|uniref:Protein import receptor MAS20 n=1 Tax=Rhizodiscina lignyota TaxID=1504668 RepID=A0A9P4IQ13_9PEZI|nr:protein import receptor MAS20 [Rhizodiscina lignyota]